VIDGPDMRRRYEEALAEVEEMKRALREHAQNVAAREKELEELRLDVAGRQGRRRPTSATTSDPLHGDELGKKIAEVEKREREAVQELALAKAERERLDEREDAIRKVERELAGLRVQLEEERARLWGSESAPAPTEPEPSHDPQPEGQPPPPTPLPQPPAEPDLDPAASSKHRRSSMLADPQLRKRS
jgi:hypothetical protein